MNEISDVLKADYLSTSLYLDLNLDCATTHQHSQSRVCTRSLSLSREDCALPLPLGAIILHDEWLRALLTMARKFRFRRVWANLALLLDGLKEGVGVGEGYM